MTTSRSHWIKRSITGIGLLIVGAIAIGAYAYPAIAATVCPSCYGMERLTPNLLVENGMPTTTRDQLRIDAEVAEAKVRLFYGSFSRRPILVACSTDECDRRLGGRGARATTMTIPFVSFIRLAPRGLNLTILTHEFSHVELHRRTGVLKLLRGDMPTWFDEGVAVIVSNDNRYLNPGATPQDRCKREVARPLPISAFIWSTEAGKDPMLYADAACLVVRWMDVNGGKGGVLRQIDAIAEGQDFQP